jgi:16S rRNA A1518/A1519 N6-dimethyltransferase RsmA/KsgA/DIM1 with predicted DNA glycosylase/AP lyase activity
MEKRVPDGENPDPIGKHTLKIISGATRFNQWMYSEIKPLLKGNILEIGSGIGNISRYIIKDGFPVTLSDYNPDYCNELKNIFSSDPAVQKILHIDLLLPNFQEQFHLLKEKYGYIAGLIKSWDITDVIPCKK